MLNWMRQWDGSKISDFWQHSRAFLWLPVFSINSTTEVSGKVFLSTSHVVKTPWRPGLRHGPCWGSLQCSSRPPEHRPLAGGEGAGCPSPKTPSRCSLYSELWLCISNYSIWLWLADVERTMWWCGWSMDQTKTLSEAFLISGREGLQP